MNKDWDEKRKEILETIKTQIKKINETYRSGPDYYFYKKILHQRKQYQYIECFLKEDYNIEILYATLVAWDMNSRGAKMLYYDEFKENIMECSDKFKQLEIITQVQDYQCFFKLIFPTLKNLYDKLNLMKTDGKLVSNSKLLHFLFPDIFMPMDRTNTLMYFYGNTSESYNKFEEITKFTFSFMNDHRGELIEFLDDQWNTTIPKLIDNAIILLNGVSTK